MNTLSNCLLSRFRLLIFGAVIGVPAMGQPKILFPATGTTTASDRIRVMIQVPNGVTEARIDVTATGGTPVFGKVVNVAEFNNKSKTVPLAEGAENTITVSLLSDPSSSASVKVTQDGDESDTRHNWESSGYIGASIDSFASNETKNFLGYDRNGNVVASNPANASGPQTGYVAGIDFSYRLAKWTANPRFPVQLWLYGETIHGQRSTEVDCNAAPDVCKLNDPTSIDPTKLATTFFAVLRNASSLEAYAGARLEFLKLNPGSSNSANLYVKSQLGFITVQNNGGDVVDDHIKFGFGAIMTNGVFKHSYLETAYGKSDLFALHRSRRFKVDAYLEFQLPGDNKFSRAVSPFFQMTVDSDFGKGSDSIRSYYGLNFDIRELFK